MEKCFLRHCTDQCLLPCWEVTLSLCVFTVMRVKSLAIIVFHVSWEKLVGRGGKGGLLVLAFRESIEKSLELVLYHLGHPFLYDSRTGSRVLLHALVMECYDKSIQDCYSLLSRLQRAMGTEWVHAATWGKGNVQQARQGQPLTNTLFT